MARRRDLIEPSFGLDKLRPRNIDAPVTWEQAAALAGWTMPTFAGRSVTPESAMRLSAVYACVRLITGVIASLPFPVCRLQPDGDLEADSSHPVWWLLNDEPCPGWSASQFWKYLVTSELLCGDQMAQVERDRNGKPINLRPMDPRQTSVVRDRASGRLVYQTVDFRGEPISLHEDDVLHVPGEGFDGLRGKSIIGWAARQSAGIALAADEYAGRFFANGARFDYALTTDKKIDEGRARQIMNYWNGRHQGLESAHTPALLTEGVSFKELTVAPEDSQLLETRQYQIIDIARAFGVPPVLIGESEKTSSWGSGIEQIVLGFVKFTVKPMLDKMADEVNRKLLMSKLARTRTHVARHDLTDLERGDTAAQSTLARNLVGGAQGPGIATVNEARRMFGLPKVADGDSLFEPNATAAGAAPSASDAKPVQVRVAVGDGASNTTRRRKVVESYDDQGRIRSMIEEDIEDPLPQQG